jgi:TPR repeat protein
MLTSLVLWFFAQAAGAADLESLRRAAQAGDAQAQNDLGYLYYRGNGVPQDYAQALDWYRKAAEQGHARAQSRLGYMYASGFAVDKDQARALELYRKSAQQGDPKGQYNLGGAYLYGLGVTQDVEEALKWFKKSATQDDIEANYAIGSIYANGQGVAKDDVEVTKWYKRAAELGHPTAQYDLAYKYQVGKGVEQDYEEARKWYEKAAAQGDSWAQNNLGYLYEHELGVPMDLGQALNWYHVAAQNGLLDGLLGIARVYKKKTPPDFAEAEKWLRLAEEAGHTRAGAAIGELHLLQKRWQEAKNGDMTAQLKLAYYYEDFNWVEAAKWYKMAATNKSLSGFEIRKLASLYERGGYGLEKDETEALKWYCDAYAADFEQRRQEMLMQNDAEAHFRLGYNYSLCGVPLADAESVKWYTKAAEEGHAGAQNNLGLMYTFGNGVAKDEGEAAKWFAKSAEQDNPSAWVSMGRIYEYGEGLAQDDVKAVYWHLKAAEHGEVYAQRHLAKHYHEGKGVAQDDVSALMWATLALSKSDPKDSWYPELAALRDELKKNLTPEQIREAGQKEEAWKAAHP